MTKEKVSLRPTAAAERAREFGEVARQLFAPGNMFEKHNPPEQTGAVPMRPKPNFNVAAAARRTGGKCY